MLIAAAALLILGAMIWVGRGTDRKNRQSRAVTSVVAIGLLVLATILTIRGDWLLGVVSGALSAGLALYSRLAPRADLIRRVFAGVAPGFKWPFQQDADTGMSESEARSLLGVGPEADAAEITAAHRRLMAMVHPDKGGAAGLAVQVNAARDRLLRP